MPNPILIFEFPHTDKIKETMQSVITPACL